MIYTHRTGISFLQETWDSYSAETSWHSPPEETWSETREILTSSWWDCQCLSGEL